MTFEPFQKVLVRDEDTAYWCIDFFEQYAETLEYPYVCLTNSYKQCLPYNDETKHLLSTTDGFVEPEPEFVFGEHVEVSVDFLTWYKAIYLYYKPEKTCPHEVIREQVGLPNLWKHCRKAEW